MDNLLNAFVVLFIVVDPIGVAWLFAALTHYNDRHTQRKIAIRAVLLATGILLVFFFIGDRLLNWMQISIYAFKIAGGVLLFLLSIDMVFARQTGLRSTTSGEQQEAERKQDVTVFPLAFPLLAGPGTLTTVLLMSGGSLGDIQFWGMLVIIVVVLALALLALLLAPALVNVLGETGANVISRLLGLLLAALAIQYVIDGIKQSFSL